MGKNSLGNTQNLEVLKENIERSNYMKNLSICVFKDKHS